MENQDPEARTQQEIREQAAEEPDHAQVTDREELELSLMDEDASEAGTVVGDPQD